MTKVKMISIVAEGTGLTKLETGAVIDGFLATMIYALSHGETVQIRELGSFRTVQRKARTARNPRTGGIILIPPQLIAKFRPAKSLRQALNRPPATPPAEVKTITENSSEESDLP